METEEKSFTKSMLIFQKNMVQYFSFFLFFPFLSFFLLDQIFIIFNMLGRGGQSALRFARLREEKRHNYVRKITEISAQLFLANEKVGESFLSLLIFFKKINLYRLISFFFFIAKCYRTYSCRIRRLQKRVKWLNFT